MNEARRFSFLFVCLVLFFQSAVFAQKRANAPNGVKVYSDLFYTDDRDLNRSLDLYLPARETAYKLPLVILIHGGGWASGDKAGFSRAGQEFVRRGFAAASINYRLTGQARWPAQVIDCKQAVRWLRAHAGDFHVDPERIVVGGHSASGHLSAFLATTNGIRQFDQGDYLNVKSDVQAELWFAGVANLISRATTHGYEGEQAPTSGESRLVGGEVLKRREMARGASPVTWVSKSTAPFYFEAGTSDRAVPPAQVDEMRQALNRYNVYSETHMVKGVGRELDGLLDLDHFDLITNFLTRVLHLDPRVNSAPLLSNAGYLIKPFSAPNLALSALSSGTDITIEIPNIRATQRWSFVKQGDNLYSIHALENPNFTIGVSAFSGEDGTPVVFGGKSDDPRQLWRIEHSAIDDSYCFVPRSAPNSALDNYGGSRRPGSKVDIWKYKTGDDHLKWFLQLDESQSRQQ